MRNDAIVSSWSGGKDSALALDLALAAGARPRALLTMLTEEGERSRSHGLRRSVLAAQAAALDASLVTAATSWSDYTATFVRELSGLSADASECVFSDIDIDEHRSWCQRVCEAAGMTALHPLWQQPRRTLLFSLLDRGWRATIVTVRASILSPSLLGRILDHDLVEELEALGVDACGEHGEYHTLVTDGPLFRAPIRITTHERILRSGCWFLDVALADQRAPAALISRSPAIPSRRVSYYEEHERRTWSRATSQ